MKRLSLYLLLSFVLFLMFMPPYQGSAAFPGWSTINTIYYNPSEDDPTNKFLEQAANELKTHLEKVQGTYAISTTTSPAAGIYLKVDAALPALSGKNDEAFQLLSLADGIHITGKTPIAVRHGAYTLLEKLGYRWFFKSSIWQIKPSVLTSLDGLNEIQEPDFIYRRIWHAVSVNTQGFIQWKEWNRLDGAADYNIRHSYYSIVPSSDPSAPPEAFCPSSDNRDQLNPENSYVIQKAIDYAKNYLSPGLYGDWDRNDRIPREVAPISPNDGRGWCWGDPSGESQLQLVTDKVYGLTNIVAKAIQTDFPGKYAGVYSYSVYAGVPNIDDLSNVFVQVATAFDVTPLNDQQRIEGLKAKGATVGIREYIEPWGWFKDLPRGKTYPSLDEIKQYASWGVTVYDGEAADSWGVYGPLYYAASKLFWEPTLDYNLIFDDFFEKSFGPAKDVMKRYYGRWFQGQKVTDRTIALSFKSLDEAEKLVAGSPEILERIRFLQYHARYIWKWQLFGAGKLTLDEEKDFYNFLNRIRDLYVVFYRYPEGSLRNDLLKKGVTNTEITSLQNTTLPTSAEARAWLDEALSYFADVDAIDVDIINIDDLDLAALNNTTLPRFSVGNMRSNALMVLAQAGDTVQGQAMSWSPYSDSIFSWTGPDGTKLEEKTVTATRNFVPISFYAPVSGRYLIRGAGRIDITSHPVAVRINDASGLSAVNSYLYVPADTKGIVINSGATNSFKLYNPTGQLIRDETCSSSCEWSMANPMVGPWKIEWSGISLQDTEFTLMGIPALVWHDPQYLLVPASALAAPAFSLTSLNRLYLYQTRDALFQVSGADFDTAADFKVALATSTAEVYTAILKPKDASTIELNIASTSLAGIVPGFYNLTITRATDSYKLTYSKPLLITKLGDLWSKDATKTAEQKRDGKVNLYDVSRLLSKWGSNLAEDLAEADINPGPGGVSAGQIDLFDANLMMRNWLP